MLQYFDLIFPEFYRRRISISLTISERGLGFFSSFS
nr:MAG TPA: Tc toxin complex TcA C-terminal TcB-binding domain [Caudoviricetes sp.]